ncbi:hypothetical protein [Mucilaginibacter sp.]|uniref:glycoside hydrolase family 78 protein n=1 Tax=Mucilaginibacter sp. TaxID=1882438 RepID=UPI0032662EE5
MKLACELRNDPLGIDVENPGFSYIIKADDNLRGIKQTACQLLVSRTPDFKNSSNLWDSKKMSNDKMAYINYAGKRLLSGRKYWWKVRVWDQHNRVSALSRSANFTMGILKAADWKAQWISARGADKYSLTSVGYKSADATTENTGTGRPGEYTAHFRNFIIPTFLCR